MRSRGVGNLVVLIELCILHFSSSSALLLKLKRRIPGQRRYNAEQEVRSTSRCAGTRYIKVLHRPYDNLSQKVEGCLFRSFDNHASYAQAKRPNVVV